ncbi:gamma-glutamyltransferase family protein [Parvularcula sp. LCG005]|uniref:gamma-glutamyltransferase family protein n=1 Tax=Parvularcula sp. LCG005 TaxID=3078805 RepID=UPI002943F8BE|nr:gamma-glutamyltransferase family protein [Parvularcula sp. LCG005]WOI54033.1 gamma-glutamyltransferase family protein [Parvularcula sp. LCG005]
MIKRATPFFLAILATACGNPEPTDPAQAPSTEAVPMGDGFPEAPGASNDHRWAVVTANPHATDAGARILAEGGSAIDAAIAVQAVLGLVEPQSSGLGGGAFLVYYDQQSGKLTTYDGREQAPMSATPAMFLKDDGTPMGFYDAVTSGKSVGIPGVVGMLGVAHAEHGVLEWHTLFEDAENLATNGYVMGERLHMLLGRMNRLPDNPAAKALFYDADGTPLPADTVLKNPDYAETLQELAAGGAGVFYNGSVAEKIAAAVNERVGPGTMIPEDFADYEPVEREPVCSPFLTYKVCSMGPPSSGGVTLLQILGLYERAAPANQTGTDGDVSGLSWHNYVEASRLAYADRDLYLADPTAMGDGTISADQLVDGLLAPDYLDSRAQLIGSEAAETVEPGDPTTVSLKEGRAMDASASLPGTSHFSIRDSFGNIVSMTTTVETAFGSHLMAGGFILNNQLTDFSFIPEKDGVPVVNAVAPGKRPRSSMTPIIVLNASEEPVMAIGSPGGSAIIGYVAKTVLANLAWGVDLQGAVDMPNVVTPRGSVIVEEGASAELISDLEAFGHGPVAVRELTSGVYGFRLDGETIEPGVDARRDGTFKSQ